MRFQREAAQKLQLSARVDAVMQSNSVSLYSVSADKAGSLDEAEVLEDVNLRRVPYYVVIGVASLALCFYSSSIIPIAVAVSTASMYAVGTQLDNFVVVSAYPVILAVTVVAFFQNIN